MPKPKTHASKAPGRVTRIKGFAEFALQQTEPERSASQRGRLPAGKISVDQGVASLAKAFRVPEERIGNFSGRVRKVRELLSKTDLRREEIQRRTGENIKFIGAVNDTFNLRQAKQGVHVPQRDSALLKRAKRRSTHLSQAKIGRRIGLGGETLYRFQQMLGVPEPNSGSNIGEKAALTVHLINKFVFRLKYLNESLGSASLKSGISEAVMQKRKKLWKGRFDDLIRSTEQSGQFQRYAKRVTEKIEKEGLAPEDAIYRVEEEIFNKRKRIQERNLERIRNGELEKMPYRQGIRLVYHTIQFYHDFPERMPQDIEMELERFVERNRTSLDSAVLKKTQGGKLVFTRKSEENKSA